MYVFQFHWHARVHTRTHTHALLELAMTCLHMADCHMDWGTYIVVCGSSSSSNNNNAIFLSSVCKDHEQSGYHLD